MVTDDAPTAGRKPAAFAGGAIIGALQGLAGLRGAEFRLPLLIGVFNFAALEAVILNKAMSLVVVASALPFRASTVPFGDVALHWPIIANLLAGSLADACFGAGLATRIRSDNPLQGGESLVRALIPLCEWGSRNRAQVTELLQQSSDEARLTVRARLLPDCDLRTTGPDQRNHCGSTALGRAVLEKVPRA